MNQRNKAVEARLTRLAQIELACNLNPPKSASWDDRVFMVIESLVMAVGQLQEAHNALVHTVRLTKKEELKSPILHLPQR